MKIPGFYIVTISSQGLVSRIPEADIKKSLHDYGIPKDIEVSSVVFERISIDEARTVRSQISLLMKSGVFLIIADRIPLDAQQSLLKVLEELPKNIYCCMCVSKDVEILPTIASRAIGVITMNSQEDKHEAITESSLEKAHKKDPELHKKMVSELGALTLQQILNHPKMSAETKKSLYEKVLLLIQSLQTARSAKMIGDFFLNIGRLSK